MSDIYSGDPRIVITPDGSDFDYIGGQPVMDQGVENLALLSILTEDIDPVSGKPWCGNVFFPDAQKVGSSFVRQARQPLTLKQLRVIEQAGEDALDDPAFGNSTCTVTNPQSTYVEAVFGIPQGSVTVKGNQQLWSAQINNPASAKVGS